MKIKKIKPAAQQKFAALFTKADALIDPSWEAEINLVLETHFNYATSHSFWFLGDFKKGMTIGAGGFLDQCSPWTVDVWTGIHPMEIARLIHPDDVTKVQTYIVQVANYFASKKNQTEIDNTKASIIFRMQDAAKKFTWRIMTYPKAYYLNQQPLLLLTLVSDYDHVQDNQLCKMFILDCNTNEKTLYYTDAENATVKKYPNQHKLTSRELEVLFWVSKGMLSKEIAIKLNISKSTVENHKQNIFQKTKTKNIAELVDFANKNKLI